MKFLKLFSKKMFSALFIILTVAAFMFQSSVASALLNFTKEDLNKVYQEQDFRDDGTTATATCTTESLTPQKSIPGPVYFVGDSIGSSIQTQLQAEFGTAPWTYQGSGINSRKLAGSPPAPDGLGQVDQDAAFVRTAKFVVVELGTNTGGLTGANISAMIDKIRIYTPSAAIFWIDLATTGTDTKVGSYNKLNQLLYSLAGPKHYTMMSWVKTVYGAGTNPEALDGLIDTNGFISTADGLNVHPTAAGRAAMMTMISQALKGTVTTPFGNCICTTASSGIPGVDNREKIYFYLLTKGLTPVQAAGIMGNMQAEAHFEPRLVEYGFLNSRNEVSKAGTATSLDDNVPPNRNKDGTPSTGVPGYGIVQFTAATYKQQLRDGAVSRGVIGGDLLLQLDTLWDQLNSRFLIGTTLNPIRASSDLRTVTDIFLNQYERPGGDRIALLAQRFGFASTILADLGSKTAPAAAGVDPNCLGGTGVVAPPAGPVVAGPVFNQSSVKIPCPVGLPQQSNVTAYDRGTPVQVNICKTHDVWVNASIAKNVDSLYRDALAVGLNLSYPGSGFRPMSVQLQQWGIRCPGVPITTNYARPPCLSNYAPMAKPGYSNHGMGLAIDFACNGSGIGQAYAFAKLSPCWNWLAANSKKYGMFEYGYNPATGIGNRASAFYEGWHWSVNGN